MKPNPEQAEQQSLYTQANRPPSASARPNSYPSASDPSTSYPAPSASLDDRAISLAARYPDPAFSILDQAHAKLRVNAASVERLVSGMRWAEGPVWFGDLGSLIWSDIPNNRMLRWDEASGRCSIFRQPSQFANGNTRDRQGRLVSCEHLSRRVTRTEYDGSITVLADSFEGKRLNSPNDVVVKSDGSIWFSDPSFGIQGFYEGEAAHAELPTHVYRIDPVRGKLELVIDDIKMPNGLCFSPDESKLYVCENGINPRRIRVYELAANGKTLRKGRIHIDAGPGSIDGIRCDFEGRLWCGWGTGEGLDGVRVFDTQANPVLHIDLPERCANLCFGGRHRNRLFMAASRSLYAVYVGTQGV
jgi:gluconolactonase